MAAAPKPKREAWQAALGKIKDEANKAFPEHVLKLRQLEGHLETASMVIDDLHDTYPSNPSQVID